MPSSINAHPISDPSRLTLFLFTLARFLDTRAGDLLVTNSEGGTDEGASVHSCIVALLGMVVCAPVEATARLGEAGDVLIVPDGAAYFMLADTNTGNPKVHRLSVKRNALSELPVRNQSIHVFSHASYSHTNPPLVYGPIRCSHTLMISSYFLTNYCRICRQDELS
jgi:hypothetical protein